MESYIHITRAESPFLSTALHDGHEVPFPYSSHMALPEDLRLREEDPLTAYLADLPTNRITVQLSRFVTDLNRSKEQCIYYSPEDAWGLKVWNRPLSEAETIPLLAYYDLFYQQIGQLLQELINKYGQVVVLDLHSYNHRRNSSREMAPIDENPEINIGTINNHPKWRSLINSFIHYLSDNRRGNDPFDVRENIRFKGGFFSKWIAQHFGETVCVLSIEFKKTFMDEWSGQVDALHLKQLQHTLSSVLPFLYDELSQFYTPSH